MVLAYGGWGVVVAVGGFTCWMVSTVLRQREKVLCCVTICGECRVCCMSASDRQSLVREGRTSTSLWSESYIAVRYAKQPWVSRMIPALVQRSL